MLQTICYTTEGRIVMWNLLTTCSGSCFTSFRCGVSYFDRSCSSFLKYKEHPQLLATNIILLLALNVRKTSQQTTLSRWLIIIPHHRSFGSYVLFFFEQKTSWSFHPVVRKKGGRRRGRSRERKSRQQSCDYLRSWSASFPGGPKRSMFHNVPNSDQRLYCGSRRSCQPLYERWSSISW